MQILSKRNTQEQTNGRKTGLLLGAHALRLEGLELAGRIAAKT